MSYKTEIIKTALPMLLYSLFAWLLKLELSFSIVIGSLLFIGVGIYLRCVESHRTHCLRCVESYRTQKRCNDLLEQFLPPEDAKPSSTANRFDASAEEFFQDAADSTVAKELSP